MVTLAPNVYVDQYLRPVDRLTPELRQRLESNLLVGFQRERTYALRDGSFSALGEQDGEWSMRLTAFVLQVFAKIEQKKLITVDGEVLIRAARWIVGQQRLEVPCARVRHRPGDAKGTERRSFVAQCICSQITPRRKGMRTCYFSGPRSSDRAGVGLPVPADLRRRVPGGDLLGRRGLDGPPAFGRRSCEGDARPRAENRWRCGLIPVSGRFR